MAKKKRDMTDHEHRVYQKSHGYDWPLDEEQAKIARERARQQQLRRQSDARRQRALPERPSRDGPWPDDEGLDDDLWEEIADLDAQFNREQRNAKTHKRRLRQLRARLPDDDA